jgi:hypothetical protein
MVLVCYRFRACIILLMKCTTNLHSNPNECDSYRNCRCSMQQREISFGAEALLCQLLQIVELLSICCNLHAHNNSTCITIIVLLTTSLFIRDDYGHPISFQFRRLIICLNSPGVLIHFGHRIFLRTYKFEYVSQLFEFINILISII